MKAIIIGAGEHGKVVLDILKGNKDYNVVGFLDDNPDIAGKEINNIKVLGTTFLLNDIQDKGVTKAIVAITDNKVRKDMFKKIIDSGIDPITVVHPTAHIANNVIIGKGVTICAKVVINIDTIVGDNTIINTGTIIEHDNKIGKNVHISSGTITAGGVKIGDGTWVGMGSRIINHLKIGKNSIIGAGSVVTKDVSDNITVMGVPAKPK